jgi:hypothetical protein
VLLVTLNAIDSLARQLGLLDEHPLVPPVRAMVMFEVVGRAHPVAPATVMGTVYDNVPVGLLTVTLAV